MLGFLCLDKREGISSFKALAEVRRAADEKKAGHTGTLDPLATGLLPIALGGASRFISFLPSKPKSYIARFRLGEITDTLDITGKTLNTFEVSAKEEDIKAVLPKFSGDIKQVPPMYSAIMHKGQRLYKLARQGIEVERKERDITIYELSLTGIFDNNEYEISVKCSEGTYIRTLIADIGEALSCGAVMTALKRTESNGFNIKNAHTIEEILKRQEENSLNKIIIPIEKALSNYPAIYVSAPQTVRFRNGGELFADRLRDIKSHGLYRVFSPDDVLLGIGEWENGTDVLAPKKILTD